MSLTDTVPDCRILSLNSANGTSFNGSQKSQVQFYIYNFHVPSKNVTLITMRIRNATIPNYFYNIIGQSLFIQYSSSSTFTNIIFPIPDGIYNIYSLLDVINSSIRTSSVEVDGVLLSYILAFDYDQKRNRITAVATNPPLQSIMASQAPSLLLMSNTLSNKLGFTTNTQLFFASITIAAVSPNISSVTTILIQSKEVQTNNFSSELNSSIIGKIPITSTLETTTTHFLTDDRPFIVSPTALQNQLTLYLYDQNGALLDFQGYDWSLTVELSFHTTGLANTHGDLLDALDQINQSIQNNQQSQAQQQDTSDMQTENPPPESYQKASALVAQTELPEGIKELFNSLGVTPQTEVTLK